MSIGVLGKKIGMTRVYDSAGVMTPVTVILVEPNTVTQVKTVEKEGYAAVQLAVGEKSKNQTAKPQLNHFKKASCEPKAFVREFRLGKGEEATVGQKVEVNRFEVDQMVDVIGVCKGRGFQGVMRKHNFRGQADAHGSTTHRRNGAIGCRSTPGRVYKNMGMPGHMGDKRTTVQNLRVVQVRKDDNALLVRGAIPGSKGSYVIVRKAVKVKPVRAATPVKKGKK